MSFAADDDETIRRRLEEIAAERNLALTGSTLTEEPKETKKFDDSGMYAYPAGYGIITRMEHWQADSDGKHYLVDSYGL